MTYEDESGFQAKSSTDDLREDDDDDNSGIFRQLEDAGQTNYDGTSDFGAHGLNSRNASAYNTFGSVAETSASNSRNVSIYRIASDDSGATPRLDCSTDTDIRPGDMVPLVVVQTNQPPPPLIDYTLSTSSSFDASSTPSRGVTVDYQSKTVSFETLPRVLEEEEYTSTGNESPAVQELRRDASSRRPNDQPVPSNPTEQSQRTTLVTQVISSPPANPSTEMKSNDSEVSRTSEQQQHVQFYMTSPQQVGVATSGQPTVNRRAPLNIRTLSSNSEASTSGNQLMPRSNSNGGLKVNSAEYPEYYECESGDSDASQSITLSIQSSVFDNSLAPSLQVTPSHAYLTSVGGGGGGAGGFFRNGSFVDSHNPSPNMSRVSSAMISPPQSYYGSGSGWVVPPPPIQQMSPSSTLGNERERPVSSSASVVSSASMEQAIQASLEEERLRREQELAYRRAIDHAMQQSMAENANSAPSREHYDLMQHRMRLEQQRRIQLLQAMARQYDTAGDGNSMSESGSQVNSETSINSATIVVGVTQEPSVYGDYGGYYR